MANTYHQIYLQAVFAVKYRKAIIDKLWSKKLHAVIGNLLNENNCKTIIVNGVEDHIHCFFGMKPVASVSDVMKNVKAKSSKYINDHSLTKSRFEWQKGYGVFSYSHSQIGNIYNYIENQEAHHQKNTFLKEYEGLLNEYGIPFDKQYSFMEPI